MKKNTILFTLSSFVAILYSASAWFIPCTPSLDYIVLLVYSPFILEIFITTALVIKVKNEYWHITNLLICLLFVIVSSIIWYINIIPNNRIPDAQDGLICIAPLVLYNYAILIGWLCAIGFFCGRALIRKYQNREL